MSGHSNPFRRAARAVAVAALAALAIASGTNASAADAPAAAPDFSRYQKLLDEYLVVISQPGQPLETRFDYFRLTGNRGRTEQLLSVHAGLAGVTPAKLAPAARRAWAINTYNFLVIELVANNVWSRHVSPDMRARGVFAVPFTSVRHIKTNGVGFFELPAIVIEGRTYNLNEFERQFCFDGREVPVPGQKTKPLPKTLDPRVHFALVCGAIGCPPLQPRAFTADSLDAELDRATRDALAGPRHLVWDDALGRVRASSVFTWYDFDFGGPTQAFEFLARHAPDSLRSALAARTSRTIDSFIPWDWDLNETPRKPAPARPGTSTPATGG